MYLLKNGTSEKAINDKQPATDGWSLVTVDKPQPTVYRLGVGIGLQEWQVSTKTWKKSSLKVKSPRKKGGVMAVNSDIICPGRGHVGPTSAISVKGKMRLNVNNPLKIYSSAFWFQCLR